MGAARLLAVMTFGAMPSLAADVAVPSTVQSTASSIAYADANTRLAFILDNPLQESDYARAERCLFPRTYEAVEILDKRHLLFVGFRDKMWLNQLRVECVGLRKDSVLIFEAHEPSLCDMDSFHSAPRGAMSGEFGAHCTLGHFEPITPAQADQLRIAFARRAASGVEQKNDE